jgi:hypothetical protein
MQRVETYRHRADVVDRAAARASGRSYGLLRHVAEQWRRLADQVYGLSTGQNVGPSDGPRSEA